jgi:hypothetical protein
LETLLNYQTQEITFRTLQTQTSISPRILQHHLKYLKEQKLVKIRINQDWNLKSKKVDNRPRLISITDKGVKYFSNQSLSDLNDVCRKLQSVMDGLITPARLDKWKQAAVWKPGPDFDTRGITDTTEEDGCTVTMLKPEELKEMLKLKEAVIGPLEEFLKEVAKRLIKIHGITGVSENLENLSFKFGKSNGVNFKIDPALPSRRLSGIDC